MKTQISIIGCGWLGLSLAEFLLKNDYSVKGSTTSIEKLATLKKASIAPYQIQLSEKGIIGNISGFLSESESVIINIPPGLRRNPSKDHVAEIKHLMNEIGKQNIKNVLYISSTSVFEDDETFPEIGFDHKPNATSKSGKQLIEIEKMLQENSKFNTTILRFGGLFGEQRHPAKYLSGKANISNPEAPINLIHRQDCIQIIFEILQNNLWNYSFNAVYPTHPTKKLYYTAYCKRNNMALPSFHSSSKSKGKRIDSSYLVQLLNYTFKQAP